MKWFLLPVHTYAYSYLLTVHALFTERSYFTHGLGKLEIAYIASYKSCKAEDACFWPSELQDVT